MKQVGHCRLSYLILQNVLDARGEGEITISANGVSAPKARSLEAARSNSVLLHATTAGAAAIAA